MIALGLSIALVGCGGAAPTGDSSQGAGAGAARKPQGSGNPEMLVRAVSAGKPGAPVEMKFEILERPEAGRAVPIVIEVTPRGADIAALDVSVQPSEALEIVSGAQIGRLEDPADGEPIRHEVRVRPRRDGVFYLSLVALVEQGAGTIARSFSIPVIVGGGAAASSAVAAKTTSPDAAVDGNGLPIVRLPAQEGP